MKNLKLALMGVCLAWTAQAAYADDCYTDDLMAYVDSRIPSGNQTERRWESIKAALLEQEGAMTLERAEEILEARRSRGLPLEHMDEVVEAIKCIANKPEEGEVEPEPEDPPQPLNTEPQQANVKQLRVYFNGPLPASSNVEYRINEDDHWESEVIIHWESNPATTLSNTLCVKHDIWSGSEHWNNGPITLPGFDNYYIDATDGGSARLGIEGHWQCVNDQTGSDDVTDSPYVSLVPGSTSDFVYRATVRTRDNNVVENDFSVADDLEFRFGTTYSGKSKFNPETETVPDRAAWRLLESEEAFPDSAHTTYCLGTGSAWERFTPLRCGDQVASKYLDRAPVVGGSCSKTHSDYTVRADVSDEAWMPDNCYPTKDVVTIPPTSSNTNAFLDNTELPIIEEDDVSWISLRKKNGKWTVSLSKPVMVTDGEPWPHNSSGLMVGFVTDTAHGNAGYVVRIPSVNGIVQDTDYLLHDLNWVRQADSDKSIVVVSDWADACANNTSNSSWIHFKSVSATAEGISSNQLPFDVPAVGSDLCN